MCLHLDLVPLINHAAQPRHLVNSLLTKWRGLGEQSTGLPTWALNNSKKP